MASAAVREHLDCLQRWMINHAINGLVAEGRDITTVVAPDADARILLTASEEVRMSAAAWRMQRSRRIG